MPQYRILPGGSFKLPDGTVKTAGEDIELDTDVAAMHSTVVAPLVADDQPPTHQE
jgi:hypothetical protein